MLFEVNIRAFSFSLHIPGNLCHKYPKPSPMLIYIRPSKKVMHGWQYNFSSANKGSFIRFCFLESWHFSFLTQCQFFALLSKRHKKQRCFVYLLCYSSRKFTIFKFTQITRVWFSFLIFFSSSDIVIYSFDTGRITTGYRVMCILLNPFFHQSSYIATENQVIFLTENG